MISKMNNNVKVFMKKAIIYTMCFIAGILLSKATKAQDAKALLWKIEGKGIEKPSYLYGTVHAICADDFFLTDGVKKALESTEQTVLELDMDDPNLAVKMQQSMLNPGMTNFSSQLTEEQKDVINTFLTTHYGADLSQLGVLKPFGLVSMVVIKTIECAKQESYEQTFVTNAKSSEKEVLGLETIEFQLSIFDELAMEEQINMLVESITGFEEGKAEFNKLVGLYKQQDIKGLYELMKESPQFAGFEDILLTKRNKAWIPKIEEIAKEKPSFFAVGAMHLGGNNGVLKLLKDAGYTLTPVK